MPPGTFARVWLARLAQPADEDKDKVFALKILRKTDGKFAVYTPNYQYLFLT